MLKKVSFENYRCLKGVKLALAPLTVLVGANATGKSSILQALQFKRGLAPHEAWQHDSTQRVRIEFVFEGNIRLTKVLKGSQSDVVWNEPSSARRSQLLHLDLNRLRSANQAAEQATLSQDGGNLTNVFASLGRRRQEELAQRFCSLVPMFSDVFHKPTGGGNQAFVFQDRWSDTTFGPHEVSDGTVLVLAYLLAQHQEHQVDLLAIEEPERGLHPYLLGKIVDLFRKMASGEIGTKPVQIVLATHSAEILDHLQPQEVRFLSRHQKDGGVDVEEISGSEPNWQQAFREYEGSLGNLWLAGGLGGVPNNG